MVWKHAADRHTDKKRKDVNNVAVYFLRFQDLYGSHEKKGPPDIIVPQLEWFTAF